MTPANSKMLNDTLKEEEWKKLCRDTTQAMEAEVGPCVTPISHAISDDEGVLAGSGSYIEYDDRRLLITNEHVVRGKGKRFGHQFKECEDVFQLEEPIAIEPPPVDLAIFAVSDRTWNHSLHSGALIPKSRLSSRYMPVNRELIFLIGYPGARSTFLFGTFISRATPLMTQVPEQDLIADLPPNQFALRFQSEGGERVDGSNEPLPTPEGMSGSIVWNTRRVEYRQKGLSWTADVAQVSGILCRWRSSDRCVTGLRVEDINSFLQQHIGTQA